MSTPAEQANAIQAYLCDSGLQKSLRTSITLFNSTRQSRLSLHRYADVRILIWYRLTLLNSLVQSDLMNSECKVEVGQDPMRAALVDIQDTGKERTVEICGVLVDCKLPPWTSANR